MLHLFARMSTRPGQAVVELAIAMPLLALMLFGLVDFGRAYFQNIALVNTAREGARSAAYGFHNLSNAANPAQDTVQGRIRVADGGLGIVNDATHIQIQFYDTTVSPAALCAHFNYATNAITWDAPYTAPNSGSGQKCPKEGDAVKVTVVSDYVPITPLMSAIMGNPLRLTAVAQTRIE
ncbi:MAG TPA: TadE family protein [Candidatus Dormibacteraeota bacterium]|nr:TadE family protein [Candidatus Dormibacteraeota bacterium]